MEAEQRDPILTRTTIAIIAGAIAVVFDTTIVSVALHTLAADLHTSVDTIQWVSTGYLLRSSGGRRGGSAASASGCSPSLSSCWHRSSVASPGMRRA